jgi:hypothetical protein
MKNQKAPHALVLTQGHSLRRSEARQNPCELLTFTSGSMHSDWAVEPLNYPVLRGRRWRGIEGNRLRSGEIQNWRNGGCHSEALGSFGPTLLFAAWRKWGRRQVRGVME